MNTFENQNLTFKETVVKVINAKLNAKTLENGYVSLKELAYVLNRSERTIRKWNEARKKGENVGIPFYQSVDNSKYIYFLEDIYQYFLGIRI